MQEYTGEVIPFSKDDYIKEANNVEVKYKLPRGILASTIPTESSFNPNAVNPDSGATGLMQFMEGTAKQYKINPKDPMASIDAAGKLYRNLLDKNGGNVDKAIAAYGGFVKKDPSDYINKIKSGMTSYNSGLKEYTGEVIPFNEEKGKETSKAQESKPKRVPPTQQLQPKEDDSFIGRGKKFLEEEKQGFVKNAKGFWKDIKDNPLNEPLAIGDAALTMGTGILGGAAGAGRFLFDIAKGLPGATLSEDEAKKNWKKAVKDMHETQKSFTWEPRTPGGKLITQAAGEPINALRYLSGEGGRALGGEEGQQLTEGLFDVGANILPAILGTRKTPNAMRAPLPGEEGTPRPRDFTPEQKTRMQRLEKQGLNPTLGDITQQREQQRFEEKMGHTSTGEDLAERQLYQTEKILENIDTLKSKGKWKEAGKLQAGLNIRNALEAEQNDRWNKVTKDSGIQYKPLTPTQTGSAIRSSVEGIRDQRRGSTRDLYEKAEQSPEAQSIIEVDSLDKYLKENEPASVAVRSLKTIFHDLADVKRQNKPDKEYKILGPDEEVIAESKPEISVSDLFQLRKRAGNLGKNDPQQAYYMREVKNIIDDIMEEQAGNLYKDATRSARKDFLTFKEQKGVNRILDMATDTDYRYGNEELFKKAIVDSKDKELNDVINLLSQNGNGTQGLNSIKNGVLDHIKKSKNPTEAIDEIGDEKLNMLFPKKTITELKSYAADFGDRKIISDLLEMATKKDYKYDTSQVFEKSVLNTTPEQLSHVLKLLATSKHGKDAIESIRSATTDFIESEVSRIVGQDQGKQQVSVQGFKNALKKIGDEKLKMIYGDKDFKAIKDLFQSARDIKTRGKYSQSETGINLMDQFKRIARRKALKMIPKVGGAIETALNAVDERNAQLQDIQRIHEALNPKVESLQDIAKRTAEIEQFNKNQKNAFRLNTFKNIASYGALPLGVYNSQQQPSSNMVLDALGKLKVGTGQAENALLNMMLQNQGGAQQ